jgi:hypothetical protein
VTARTFEKRLRDLHRAELERAPELRREFKKRRKSENVARSRMARNLLVPVFWCTIFYAMVQSREDLAWAAGIVALWTAGTALKWAHQWFHQFYASEDLVVLSLLPLNDRQIFQFQLRRYWRGAVWIAWEMLLIYLALALLPGDLALPIYAFLVAAFAQTALVLALALHCASYLHMLPLATLAGLFRMSAIVLLVLGAQGFDFTASLVRATEWFLPMGWVHYVMLRAARDWAALGLVIPLAAIVYLARYSFDRLRSFYSLEGFEIIPGPAHAAGVDHQELTAGAFNQRAGPTEIEDRISAGYFLEGVNWNLRGGLEKVMARFLNPRERVITEFLVAQDPGWTRSLKWSFWVWLVVSIIVLVFGNYGTMVFFGAYLLGAATLPLFGGDWRGMRQSAAGGMFIPGYSLYPITFNEIARIFLKVNLVRILAASPLIVSFGAIAAFKLGHPPAEGAIVGMKLLGTIACLQPLLVLFPISSTTNDTSRMLSSWLLVFLPILLLLGLSAFAVFLSDTAIGVFVGFGALSLFSGLLFVLYRRAYRAGKFDLLNPRSRSGGE